MLKHKCTGCGKMYTAPNYKRHLLSKYHQKRTNQIIINKNKIQPIKYSNIVII